MVDLTYKIKLHNINSHKNNIDKELVQVLESVGYILIIAGYDSNEHQTDLTFIKKGK